MKRQRGGSTVVVVLVLIALSVVLLAGWFAWQGRSALKNTSLAAPVTAATFTIESPRLNRIIATFKNNTSHDITEHFSSGCVEPDVFVNGAKQSQDLVCVQAITHVTIPAGSEKRWELLVRPELLTSSHNSVRAAWSTYRSNTIDLLAAHR